MLYNSGPIGTGKTHLAIAPGVEAARRRYQVVFTRAADLVRDLHKAKDARMSVGSTNAFRGLLC